MVFLLSQVNYAIIRTMQGVPVSAETMQLRFQSLQ